MIFDFPVRLGQKSENCSSHKCRISSKSYDFDEMRNHQINLLIQIKTANVWGFGVLFVETLQIVDCGNEVKIHFCEHVAIGILLDVLKCELFQDRLLAVKIADIRL